MKYAQADYDTDLIPGYRDITELISYPAEVLINSPNGKLTKEQEIQLRKNKCQFTAAEDNLLLRGVVSLFGDILDPLHTFLPVFLTYIINFITV